MDLHAHCPSYLVGHQCEICDIELASEERCLVDVDYATDTGASIRVRHVHCHRAVLMAQREALDEIAKIAKAYLADDVQVAAEHRILVIDRQVSRLPGEGLPLSASLVRAQR